MLYPFLISVPIKVAQCYNVLPIVFGKKDSTFFGTIIAEIGFRKFRAKECPSKNNDNCVRSRDESIGTPLDPLYFLAEYYI
jgi:hypothetical protein